jgi:hypothetical protein
MTYDDAVFATGPVVFWVPEAAAVVDRVGGRDAVGLPTLAPGLTGAGTALACGGTVLAERAHAAALKPARGTLMAWVRPATVANHWPVGADPAGEQLGDFALRLWADGAAGAYFQNPAATPRTLPVAAPSYYAAGQIICIVVTFDGSGFKVYLDGHHIGTNAAHTSGLAGNGASWALGADRPDGTIFNGEIDRVTIWDRVLSRNEIYLVSLLEPPP